MHTCEQSGVRNNHREQNPKHPGELEFGPVLSSQVLDEGKSEPETCACVKGGEAIVMGADGGCVCRGDEVRAGLFEEGLHEESDDEEVGEFEKDQENVGVVEEGEREDDGEGESVFVSQITKGFHENVDLRVVNVGLSPNCVF